MSVSRSSLIFLVGVLSFVILYSVSTLTTKPAYWYDEAINVELAHNFASYGKLDLIIAPHTFSGQGATVGSTGYTVTLPLAGFFKVFGFGLTEARVYMLLWMCALVIVFFFIARKLWGNQVAYGGTLLIASFAPFYGNGRSVMGEIPGFLFFLGAFYFFEQKKWWQSGLLLGLSVVSKPSVFIFLIPAFVLAVLCEKSAGKAKLVTLIKLGASSALALIPWFLLYVEEITRGGLGVNILNHFKNPYAEAGVGVLSNMLHNLPTLVTSTTLLYMWGLLAVSIFGLFLKKELLREHAHLLIISSVYIPLALLQYLKSFGYLRYFVGAELLLFILFLIALPEVLRWVGENVHLRAGTGRVFGVAVTLLCIIQLVHLFGFSDIYPSDKTQKTIVYLYSTYPTGTVGVINVPQIASFVPSFQKYQYLSTYGLWNFGAHMLYLAPERLPDVIVAEEKGRGLSAEEEYLFETLYERDTAFTDGFSIYRKR